VPKSSSCSPRDAKLVAEKGSMAERCLGCPRQVYVISSSRSGTKRVDQVEGMWSSIARLVGCCSRGRYI
jgi:hypothetical protein